jgi:hypothetical protein
VVAAVAAGILVAGSGASRTSTAAWPPPSARAAATGPSAAPAPARPGEVLATPTEMRTEPEAETERAGEPGGTTAPGTAAATAPAAAAGGGTAAAALERTRAAYEYGDIDEVVEWSRRVTEGGLKPTPQERVRALRYLGIGLFLTGRSEGAETAFFELLRLKSETRLDPTTTRPDVVAFFEQVRARHAEEIRVAARANRTKLFLWNFLPPMGQFQNGDRARGVTVGALELVSLGTAVTTYAWLRQGEHAGYTHDDPSQARALKIVNYAAVAVLAATYTFGVIDSLAHYGDTPDEDGPSNRPQLSLGPGSVTLKF